MTAAPLAGCLDLAMDLILWRHADAESGIPDEERPLSAQGLRQAARMARWLKARLPAKVSVLVSPARRAQQTAHALTAAFESRPAIGTMTTPTALLGAAGWPETEGTVVVVGHQPTLGQAAALALIGQAADLRIETGAIWWLVRAGRGKETRLRGVISPELL